MPKKLSKLLLYTFLFFVTFLTLTTLNKTTASWYTYLLFTIIINALFLSGLRKGKIYFDTFIGLYFWIGFWLKLSLRVSFFGGTLYGSIGNFLNSGSANEAYDRALIVVSIGILPLLIFSFFREKFLYSYVKYDDKSLSLVSGATSFYNKNRKLLLSSFVSLVLIITLTNSYFGFYQRGSAPRTILPLGLNGIYTWLLLFGLTSVSTYFLFFEILLKKRLSILIASIAFLESFFSNVSLLSRGMVLNGGALFLGAYDKLTKFSLRPSLKLILSSTSIFILLFLSSILLVNFNRAMRFVETKPTSTNPAPQEHRKQEETPVSPPKPSFFSIVKNSGMLFLDRWVGIEGVMAVSSYPNLGPELWDKAWAEKFKNHGTSFYDSMIIDSPYSKINDKRLHFISLPGIVAFLFYKGSYLFLFSSMLFLAALAAGIEYLAYRFGGANLIFCSLISQVVAYRYAHFGYVPSRSHLLMGTIFLNIFIIYFIFKIISKLEKFTKQSDHLPQED